MQTRRQISLFILFLIVMANYIAQIPYGIHLYGHRFNLVGVMMLGITLVWFLTGFILLVKRIKIGYWILLSFLFVEFIFYFHGQIILMFVGYGLMYHLVNFKDMILWWVFFIGDVNFFVAGFYLYYLLRRKKMFL